jgi:hypothetical protein
MSIRFACKCGKHLRAADTMAGRYTLCPKCGAMVGIPKPEDAAPPPSSRSSLSRPAGKPALSAAPEADRAAPVGDDAEELGPVLVRVRRRNDKDPNKYRASVWVPLDPDRGPPPEKLPKPKRTDSRRYVWRLETYWFQSLAYPFRARRLLTGLGLLQASFLVWAAVLIPRLNGIGSEPTTSEIAGFAGVAFFLFAYTVGLFDCVLSSAGAGEYRVFRCPGLDLGLPSVTSWLFCFLAGPVVPATFAYLYWSHCGDPDLLDQIVLAELAGATFCYLLLAVLAAREAGDWVADPAAVAAMIFRLGPRALLAAAGVPAFAYVYAKMVFAAMVRLHVSLLWGIPSLVVATIAGMFGAVTLLRILGVWSYYTRQGGARPVVEVTEPGPDSPPDA